MARSRILPWIVLATHAVVIVVFIFDLAAYLANPQSYASVYKYDEGGGGYLAGWVVVTSVGLVGIAAALGALLGGVLASRFLKLYVLGLLLWVAYSSLRWMIGGFDHL